MSHSRMNTEIALWRIWKNYALLPGVDWGFDRSGVWNRIARTFHYYSSPRYDMTEIWRQNEFLPWNMEDLRFQRKRWNYKDNCWYLTQHTTDALADDRKREAAAIVKEARKMKTEANLSPYLQALL